MKTWKLTLICLTLITSVMLGIFAVEMGSAGKTARVKGFSYPRTYTLDHSVPQPWNIDLKFAPPRGVDEINTSTILLEGLYSPLVKGPYNHPKKRSRVVVPFDGYDVLAVAIAKLSHMGPIVSGSHLVTLEITGLLKDGTPFSTGGSCVIVLFVPDNPYPGPIF